MNKILLRIDQLCVEKNISKYKLAQNTGIPYSTITNSFRNDTMPTISTLEKICAGIGITMAQFFSESGQFPNLTEEQQGLLKIWDAIPPGKHEVALAYLRGLAERE